MEVSLMTVFWFALLTAVATGFGALPFFLFKQMNRTWLGISNSIASGLMITASFSLIYEGINYNLWLVIIGIMSGLGFILASNKVLERYEHLKVGNLEGINAKKALLIVGVMTLHSFTEGVGVGVSFGGGMDFGLFITAAIAVHNIPEGLAISLVLVPRGVSVWYAAFWSIFSSIPQPITAVPSYMFVEFFKPFLPVGLGFAAGAMIWMVFSELVPEASEDCTPSTVGITITISVAIMVIFQEFLRH